MLKVLIDLEINDIQIPQLYIKDFLAQTGRILEIDRLKLSLVRTEKLLTNHDIVEGSKVKLSICYKGRYPLTSIFKGFISEAHKDKQYITIEAEDYSYLLKEVINQSYNNVSDGDIIKQILLGKEIFVNVTNKKFYSTLNLEFTSVRKALRYIAKDSGSDCFFIGDEMYYGEKYNYLNQRELPVIDLDHPSMVSKDNLKQHEENSNLKVVSITRDKDGKIHTGKSGTGKEIRRVNIPGLSSGEIQSEAELVLKDLKKGTYRGSVKLLAEPLIFHSMKIKIINEESYTAYVDAVHYTFSQSASLRQELFIGQSSDENSNFVQKRKGVKSLMKEKKSNLGYKEKVSYE